MNPWPILIMLIVLLGSNGLTWWKASNYAESQCVARVQLANATLDAAKDRLQQRISAESYIAAMRRSREARSSDAAYSAVLTMIGETSVNVCAMPQKWWDSIHEIR